MLIPRGENILTRLMYNASYTLHSFLSSTKPFRLINSSRFTCTLLSPCLHFSEQIFCLDESHIIYTRCEDSKFYNLKRLILRVSISITGSEYSILNKAYLPSALDPLLNRRSKIE